MKRILVTRPRLQADAFAASLIAAGFEPVFFPVIEIRPLEDQLALDRALQKLACYDWVVFTSANAVELVWERMESLGIERIPEGVRVAAIGPKTAESLQTHGTVPAFVPQDYVAEAILPGLGDLAGRWVLLPRAAIARKALPEAIAQAGGVPHEIAIYDTLPAQPDPAGLAALAFGVDVVTLTSPSVVNSFVKIIQAAGLDPRHLPGSPVYACIGPITEKAAREAGLPDLVMADEYTTAGLIKAIQMLETR